MTDRNLSLMLLLLLLTAACGGRDDDQVAELTIPVNVEAVQRGDIAAYIAATGTVQAQQEENVTTEVEGVLHLVRSLAAGQTVRAGQLLAEIDNPEYLLDVRVESQKMAMENAQRELTKQEALFKEGGVTEKELEIARRTALDARLNYETAMLKTRKVRIVAPISGTVASLQTVVDGTRVPARFQVCSVKDYSSVLIPVKLPNTDAGRVRPGQEVLIRNYALPDEVFKGRIKTIDPTIDPQTRTFTVTVEAPNPNRLLRPGMFVKTDIVQEYHTQAIVIPKTGLQVRNNTPVVFVVEGASAEMREVTTGIETGDTVEIVSGLNESERLVVKGQETLRDKAKVRILQ
ncbi:MAG: efflux RND transporter periplasmic adaptor subunit [Candidatus Latescibacteria bacterium]|nr:efflux RND transporter periplasmic adaptor subunit [Candidatus Latescibacterota bacterium]